MHIQHGVGKIQGTGLRMRSVARGIRMLRKIALATLVAVSVAGASTGAEAQWWRALGTILRGAEEAVPALRTAPKAAPEEISRAQPKTEAPVTDAMSGARRSGPAALSAARASALWFSRCVSGADMKSQDCNRQVGKLQTVDDADGLGFNQTGILADGCHFPATRDWRVATSI